MEQLWGPFPLEEEIPERGMLTPGTHTHFNFPFNSYK